MTEPIALQLWTLRELYEQDPIRVLERVAAIGYPAVELVYSLTGRLSPAATRAALERLGLVACSMHAFFDELDDHLDQVLAATLELELELLVCAWVDSDKRRSLTDYERLVPRLAELGARCRDQGVQLVYHHHDFELNLIGERRGMQVILDGVDSDLLKVEADVYWVDAAGLDPIGFLDALGDRCVLLHCKDRAAANAPPLADYHEGAAVHSAEVGNGVLDFPAILAAAPYAKWLIVEQDFTPGDPYDSVASSLRNLRALLPNQPQA